MIINRKSPKDNPLKKERIVYGKKVKNNEKNNEKNMEKNMEKNKKIYVLCQTVLMFDENAHLSFDEHDVIIPAPSMIVIERCRNEKNTHQADHAERVYRSLDRISEGIIIGDGWISLGENRGNIKMGAGNSDSVVDRFAQEVDSNSIIDIAQDVAKENPDSEVIIVSRNAGLRTRARVMGIKAEKYKNGNVSKEELEKSSIFYMSLRECSWCVDVLNTEKFPMGVPMQKITDQLTDEQKQPNTYFIVGGKGQKRGYIFYHNPIEKMMVNITEESHVLANIVPNNNEQRCLAHALSMPHITLLAATGTSGTGKTLLGLASVLELGCEDVMLTKPPVTLGEETLGLVPGGLREKLGPWCQSYMDNIKVIKKANDGNSKIIKAINSIGKEESQKGIRFEAIEYFRGRSLNNTTLMADEVQNLFPSTVRALATRIGKGSRFIALGDLFSQNDTSKLTIRSNGLTHFTKKMQGAMMFVHIHLKECERSDAAKEAAKRL